MPSASTSASAIRSDYSLCGSADLLVVQFFRAHDVVAQRLDIHCELLRVDGAAVGLFVVACQLQAIVLAHFVFSKGIGSLLKSGLRKKIDNGGSVDEEFAKWCYYTDCKTGKKVYSKVAANIQKWENEMWHQDDILYAKAELQKRNNR